MNNFQVLSMRKDIKANSKRVLTKQVQLWNKTEALSNEAAKDEGKWTKRNAVDVYINIDSSLRGWTENCVIPHKKGNHFNSKRSNINSIYCEVLASGNCHHCQTNEEKLTSINSSLARFPDLETGGYLLFKTLSEKQKFPERNTFSALSFNSASTAPDSGYSSSESSGSLRRRVRAASAILSDFNRKAIGSVWSDLQFRPFTSKTTRFEDISRTRGSLNSHSSKRKISPMSQEGWSEKQIEAWKLLAPTPPQIEVSQMNVSMYTPKELPGIKIFDESLFVI